MVSDITVMTIAGFDPSGCAGILADVKTFEAHGVQSKAVLTANTIQDFKTFQSSGWVDQNYLFQQLDLMLSAHQIDYVKIGLIENFSLLHNILIRLKEHNAAVKIIWDPIFAATANMTFHTSIDMNTLIEICKCLYLITPNANELNGLMPENNLIDAAHKLARHCSVLLKGGHLEGAEAVDTLFQGTHQNHFYEKRLENFSKRGTGCILSAAILSNLALGKDLVSACAHSKNYITNYLKSSTQLIGYHDYASHS